MQPKPQSTKTLTTRNRWLSRRLGIPSLYATREAQVTNGETKIDPERIDLRQITRSDSCWRIRKVSVWNPRFKDQPQIKDTWVGWLFEIENVTQVIKTDGLQRLKLDLGF